MMTGIRSCSGTIVAFAARVMMVNDSIVSLGEASSKSVSALSRDGGLIQRSHKPAKQNGSPLLSITRNGCRFPSRLPFIKTVGRNQTAPMLERLTKRIAAGQRFRPRIDVRAADAFIFRPGRNQPPAHEFHRWLM